MTLHKDLGYACNIIAITDQPKQQMQNTKCKRIHYKIQNQEMLCQINKNTSSGEKKATESGYTEPAGCKDITARKIDGNNSSITEIFSATSSFIVVCPNLFVL